MKKSTNNPKSVSIITMLVILLTGITTWSQTNLVGNSRTQSFDKGWKFLKDNPTEASKLGFDDSGWRKIDLPHDWSIEDLPNQKKDSVTGPFSITAFAKISTGYATGGTAWYRKSFTINVADKDKKAYLQFDGVYQNSDVYVNGKHLGNHRYGYTSFWYDITPYLNPAGQANVVAVQVKNEDINSRWYSGSGIYRHTWLTLASPVHIAPWGVYVTTPKVEAKTATVAVETKLNNTSGTETSTTIVITILDSKGKAVGKSTSKTNIPAGQTIQSKQVVTVLNPSLWSLDKPILYKAKVEVLTNSKVEDQLSQSFGIRSIKFDAKTGFTLNGKKTLLKGGCIHHDNGPLGSKAIDRAEERKIEVMKKNGFNALRLAHNPPSQELLDACDRLGMLVIDEAFDNWEKSKMASAANIFKLKGKVDDYSLYFKDNWQKDLQSILLRDRNHPSIIMWSIGNEIGESAEASGLKIATELAAEVRKYDTTRAVTEGVVDAGIFEGDNAWARKAPHMAQLDVVGYNYGLPKYEEDHAKYPNRIVYASEFEPSDGLEYWEAAEKHPHVLGSFMWSGMDYIGEAGTGTPRIVDEKSKAAGNEMAALLSFFKGDSWPHVLNFQGDVDLIGNPKVGHYYSTIVWRDAKVQMLVHSPVPAHKKEIVSPFGYPDLLKSWNWAGQEGEKMQVVVYTRCKTVKLELNGKIVGEQKVDDSKSIIATFDVPYTAGKLVAHCYDAKGVEVATETIKTVGAPAGIRLSADRSNIKADRNDLSYVQVQIVDAEGNLVPDAATMVNFNITGNGEIAGVGTGSSTDVSSYQQPRKTTWQGKCLAIVRPNAAAGKMVLTASADGLKSATVEIVTK
jgi:beta-galactosidase